MRRAILSGFVCAALSAGADRWIDLRTESVTLYTNAGAKAGRDALIRVEQFRHALGKTAGGAEWKLPLPADILLFRDAGEAAPHMKGPAIHKGRERITIVFSTSAPPGPAFYREFAQFLLATNTDRLPAPVERGLVALFSTLDVAGTRVTLGRPVPQAERDADWARMHLLAVEPDYYGKLPTMIRNLGRGIDEDVACRNSFGKGKAEIDKLTASYLSAGKFGTTSVSGLTLDEHDLPERPVEEAAVEQKLAALAKERAELAEYTKLLGTARTGSDDAAAVAALERARQILPKEAEPLVLLAAREKDPKKKIELLKTATGLDRRNAGAWQALAEAYQSIHEYSEASKAWRAGEQASAGEEQRARMRAGRLDIERQRLDFEEAERRRAAEEKERELAALKQAAVAELRALEAKANQGSTPRKPDEKVVPWWDGPRAEGKIEGMLKQVDCMGQAARLLIEGPDKKITRLLVRDAGQIAILGEREQTLGCGTQKPRRIVVEYFPKKDPKLGTAGDVATIAFP